MPLLLSEDYEYLEKKNIRFIEFEAERYLIFEEWLLPEGQYSERSTSILVVIPNNYNDQGNDMFWACPPLVRKDGQTIPAVIDNEKKFQGKGWQRWSRHWSDWRAGEDNVRTILRRISWCVEKAC